MLRSRGRAFQAVAPGSVEVVVSLIRCRNRRLELFRQGPGLEGPHRPAFGVWCEESLEFLINLRSMDVC